VGKISGQRIDGQLKLGILDMIEWAGEQGISVQRSCSVLMINRRRIIRWQNRIRRGLGVEDTKPGPREVLHRLLPLERQQVLDFARKEVYVDLSHRILTVTAWEMNLFFVSFSTVYRILRDEGLMTQRGCHRRHNGRSLAPVRKELTGSNQRWCWDISYLYTYEKSMFLYLYLLLDEYSRKAVSWLISWRQDSQTARDLLDKGLVEESILDLPEQDRPEIINDRGRQMKAKPVHQLLRDHAMPQMFARPRTPNDNPFVESAFSTLKRIPEYPGRFRDLEEAQGYFIRYFQWYNEEHYHSGINYVTPVQVHNGLRDKILADRRQKFDQHRQWRKEANRRLTNDPNMRLRPLAKTSNQSDLCSVICS
jgi:transposase InsO family protein